jgi:phosphonate transport system substrate-binding protein
VPVQFHLAQDYDAHLEKLRRHEYDLTADALIFSRIAQRQFGYLPLARTQAPLQPVLVRRRTVPPHPAQGRHAAPELRALQGQTVAVSDGLATLTVIAMRYLRDNGLRPGADVQVRVAGSHANAMQLVLLGQAQAAVVSLTALHQVDPATAAQLQIIRELPAALSAVVYLLAPRLAHLAPTLTPALLHFANQQATGRAFIESLGHQGLLPVGPELAEVDPLVVEFYRLLAQGHL